MRVVVRRLSRRGRGIDGGKGGLFGRERVRMEISVVGFCCAVSWIRMFMAYMVELLGKAWRLVAVGYLHDGAGLRMKRLIPTY